MASVTILSDNGATSGSAGLKTSGGNDGVLLLQTTTSGGTPTTAISISNTQVVTYTNQPTYTGGTANGVLYLNGSKAVTSGTALVFDGTNLGLGVTPSAWSSIFKSYQVGSGIGTAFLAGRSDAGAAQNQLGANAYFDGSWRYVGTGVASRYEQSSGVHSWHYAASGTAGNAITFTQAMTLDADGKLGVGSTSPSQRLVVQDTSTVHTAVNITNGSGNYNIGVTGPSNTWGAGAGALVVRDSSVGATRMVIDSSGNLLVGTTSLASSFSGFAQIEASGSTGGVLINSATNNIGRLIFTNNNTSGSEGLIRYDGSNNSMQFWTAAVERARITSGGNLLQLTGRKSNAYTLGNQQMWVYASGGVANGGTIALCAINQIYDNLCYELDIFVNRGGYFAAKYAGVFGYNGFTKAITTGDTGAAGLTMTGTTYNETMTITNSSGVTVNQYIFCLRVWGLGTAGSVSTGGADLVTSSYLTRIE